MTFEYDTGNDKRPALAGHAVFDAQLRRVGTVTDVLFDERERMPKWAVVKTGIVGAEHFVPLAASYLDENGRLVTQAVRDGDPP